MVVVKVPLASSFLHKSSNAVCVQSSNRTCARSSSSQIGVSRVRNSRRFGVSENKSVSKLVTTRRSQNSQRCCNAFPVSIDTGGSQTTIGLSAKRATMQNSSARDVRVRAFGGAARGGSWGTRRRFPPILSVALQVLFFYLLFRGGAGGFLRIILYTLLFLSILPLALVTFARFMTISGKCPNCGSTVQVVKGSKVARMCMVCRTPIAVDPKTKEFTRAGPSWEQPGGQSGTGAAGQQAYGSSNQSYGAPNGAYSASKSETAGDIIDVEVVDITPLDKDKKGNDSQN